MDYISRNHSKYLLMCHLIFVCKYRKKLLVIFEKEIKQIFLDIAKENGFGIIESDGYFACSIGNVSKEAIEKYIQEQG